MKKTDLRKVLAAVTVVSVAAGLVLAGGCKSSCSGGSCSGGKPATTDTTQPKSSCSGGTAK
ncbi:MAG: hypothetical protein ABSA67_09695 [Candidatus Brocadiia bacterium]